MREWFEPVLLGQVAITGIAAGLAAALFAEMTHGLHGAFAKIIPYAPLRPFVGGLLIIALTFAVGTREYLGLGVTSPNAEDMTISTFFLPGGGETWAWFWKMLFTALTLSCGFKGGEVTPLFFIGAALGYSLSGLMDGPVDLLAAIGFVAIFAGATNTPIASTIMGMELFGMRYGPYLALGCGLAFLCSGPSGIYLSQRVGQLKRRGGSFPPGTSLRQLRERRWARFHRIVEAACGLWRRRR
jgi:H+/Cl- antiporter ClcA